MKTRFFLSILLVSLALVAAQGVASNGDQPAANTPASNFISNDDGGQVEIVPVNLAPRGPRKARVAPAMKSVQQVSIFLGSGWADDKVRSRERELADLAASGNGGALDELKRGRTEVLQAAPSIDDFSDFSGGQVNDLALQRKLTDLLEHKTISEPQAGTIYVVFLAPGMKSSIGGHVAGVEYAAYHNLLHGAVGNIRYVVVPFDENRERQSAAAERAFVDTVFNPSSD